jgi:very-short-patch-repair endonuclease
MLSKKRLPILQQSIDSKLQEAVKQLRANQTPAEGILWECLRNSRLNGWKFRRQQIIRSFIVDFYCHKAGLVVELDGSHHASASQKTSDQNRDQILTDLGLHVIRFSNDRIGQDLEQVLKEIITACES